MLINDTFWTGIRETIRQEGIPYQWEAINDRVAGAAPSFCMRNFRIASGKEKGKHGGYVFQDSDVAKWLEGVAWSLMSKPDTELEALADTAISEIIAAQQPDGYLDTYYIINGLEKRWTNLMDNHELYCAGHMIEAAVAYYRATGKRSLLDAVLRLVDHIDNIFGHEEGKIKGYPGHPVIEMALIKLYELTGNRKHLALAKYFIDERGIKPNYFEEEKKKNGNECVWDHGVLKLAYYQAHEPVRQQKEAVGHAVRALYLYSGMADVARETGDQELMNACRYLWESVTKRRMYITGAVGSSEYGESFTYDYDLPNDLIYGETCASIALVFFAWRMLQTEIRGEYADTMEKALFNTVLSGMQQDGKKFFYVNPLEVLPEACEKDQRLQHVKPVRQPWFGCACCPPNLIRLIMSLENYLITQDKGTVYIHSYIGSEIDTEINGNKVAFRMTTDYPWNGQIHLELQAGETFDIALRIPGWCKSWTVSICNKPVNPKIVNGYIHLQREWHTGDTVELNLEMSPIVMHASPHVYRDLGLVAVTRGPFVYCLEEEDNGKDLHLIKLSKNSQFKEKWDPDLLGGIISLESDGERITYDERDNEELYTPATEEKHVPVKLHWIPYYTWCNRRPGEMRVWVHQ